jgi:hypothetical protein
MEHNEDYIEFISSESRKNEVDLWYRKYDIRLEKTELFSDYIISLLDLIESTYLGDEFMETSDMENHFMWCLNKIIDDFEKEKIFFKNSGLHVEYLWTFFLNAFYISETKIKNLRIYLQSALQFNYDKTKNDLELLTEFYIILNQSLKK